MKTSKILLKILVVLIIAIAMLIPSTFSWYNHNGVLSGREMSYVREDLPASSGTVSVSTKCYKMNPDNLNKVFYDQKGNKEYIGNAITTDTLNATGENARKVQYYGTTFTNSSKQDVYANLYLENFTNDSNVYIGTLQPNLTFKGLSSSVHLTNKNKIRVYFQWLSTPKWSSANATNYVVYTTKSGNKGWYIIEDHIEEANAQQNPTLNAKQVEILQTNITNTYYVDLPEDTVEFYFATNGAVTGGFDTSTYETTESFFRTKSITNIQPETGYYLTGSVDDTTWNAEYKTFPVPGGVSIKTCFDTITINKNQHAYITLSEGKNYTGSEVVYNCSDENITVNANTGLVSTTGSFTTGSSATITTTITGSLGDEMSFTTDVSNPSTLSAVPVSLNVKVPAGTFEGNTCKQPGTAEIVWYIENRGNSNISFTKIYHTK